MKKQAFIVIGLGYGDEGKGSITDYLAHEYRPHTVIRFNGGPQAAHHVIAPDGNVHCFSQFGAGTFVPGVKTFLSQFMLVDPLAMISESEILKQHGIEDPLSRMTIDQQCLIVTPFHKLINRMLETSRGAARHGSCGRGVGQAVADAQYLKSRALIAADLKQPRIMREKLLFSWRLKLDLAEQLIAEQPDNQALVGYFDRLRKPNLVESIETTYQAIAAIAGLQIRENPAEKLLSQPGTVIFEGAQGALLDVEYGFWPHVTKTRTTFYNADEILKHASYSGKVTKLGVMRAYSTRHGAGPFITQDDELTALIPDLHNQTNQWQRDFKIGWFDLVTASYALEFVGNLDSIALTNLDRLQSVKDLKLCVAYQYCGKDVEQLAQFFQFEQIDEQFIIKRIKVPLQPNHQRQQRLMELLGECQPIYQSIEQGVELTNNRYINYLSEKLSTPISIISTGPMTKDKKYQGNTNQ